MSTDISLAVQISRHARYRGDRTALIYEGESISYTELERRVRSLAAALKESGVSEGERVAYLGYNSSNFIVTLLAAGWLGAVFMPINFRLAGPEVSALLEDGKPRALVAEPAHAVLGVDAFESVGTRVIIDDDPAATAGAANGGGVDPGGWVALTEFISKQADPGPSVPRYEDDLAALLYTSGTTGRPKGVMLTHGNLWWNIINQSAYNETHFDDIYLAVAPLFHIGALNTHTLGALYRGSTVVIRRAFDPAQTLDDLQRFPINGVFAVAAMFTAISRVPGFEQADLGALRLACAAGAPVPPALLETYAQKGVLLQQAWGLTETAPCATYLESSEARRKLGSAGVPMPYGDVRVSDLETHDAVLTPGGLGELWVRGPNVAAGYWNNPDASAAAFLPDGWFRTGDIGYVDEDGFFFIVDRLKDMVISGGENIYPAEIEHVLARHPDITDAAVVGAADERWGEVPVAVVSVGAGATLTLEGLRDFCALNLARYKLPRRLVIIESVPRNASGKLDKPEIRRLVAAAEES